MTDNRIMYMKQNDGIKDPNVTLARLINLIACRIS